MFIKQVLCSKLSHVILFHLHNDLMRQAPLFLSHTGEKAKAQEGKSSLLVLTAAQRWCWGQIPAGWPRSLLRSPPSSPGPTHSRAFSLPPSRVAWEKGAGISLVTAFSQLGGFLWTAGFIYSIWIVVCDCRRRFLSICQRGLCQRLAFNF